MRDFLREHFWAVVMSVLLHGALVGGLVLAALISAQRKPPSLQPLPIEAVVVDSQVLHAAQREQEDRAAQEAARARAAEEAKAAAAAAEQAKAVEDANAAAAAAAAKASEESKTAEAEQTAKAAAAEQQRLVDAQKAGAQKVASQKATAAQKAAAAKATAAQKAALAHKAAEADLAEQAKREAEAKRAADAKAAADAKQAAEAKRIADANAAAAKARDDRARQDREAELRRQLADEEHRSAVESGPLRDSYIARLRGRIQSAWIKPPSASVGVDCLVEVTQIPGGEVTGARVTQCNGDAAVRQSIENAVYRASPLPEPPDPALFERNFKFRFKPDE